jgi:hypothetical protein
MNKHNFLKLFRAAFLSILLLGSVAHAELINGDFSSGETGWTQWRAPWGYKESWDASSGVGRLSTTDNSSFGWYQIVAVAAGTNVTVDALWAGFIGNPGWAEVMLFTVPSLVSFDPVTRIDTGAFDDIAFKKDHYSINLPAIWDWQPASLSPYGNEGTVLSQGYVVVAMKYGGFGGYERWVSWDNIVLTGAAAPVPEPSTMLLLGSGLIGLAGYGRRKLFKR